jgi:hypothetical protein
MPTRLSPLLVASLLAFAAVGGARAQSGSADDQAALPVWNNDKLEAVLLLEPAAGNAGARWKFGRTSLDAAFGLQDGDSLGLLCDRKNGIAGAIGDLAEHCSVAALGGGLGADGGRRASATASLARAGNRLGLSFGSGRDLLPAWLSPRGTRFEQTDLTVFAQKSFGSEAVVSIGGTVAHARLVPADQVPALADRWSSKSLSIGGGIGDFGASIVGRVVDVPGQPEQWQGVGLGLTWRTPWSGKLTVGAENVVTRGRNPFSPAYEADEEEGTVPYVRYEQDL